MNGHPNGIGTARPVNFDTRPMLVFWEVTRACLLACQHCRASATPGALHGELTSAEGLDMIEQVAGFGHPYPILVLTGGDCLLRPDIFTLVDAAVAKGIPVALSPSVTPRLTDEAIATMVAKGVKAVSLSLDGACPGTHDGIRNIPGSFDATLVMIDKLVAAGLTLQINTTVMARNLEEMADIAALVAEHGVHMWEVFFLVHVGRGEATGAISAAEHEDVCHFLFDAAHYGFIVRTVEAPFFRRVVAQRRAGGAAPASAGYAHLSARLAELLGEHGDVRPSAHTASTRDGKGIVFIAHDGEVYPAGFLPLRVGDVRTTPLAEIYRDSEVLRDLRAAAFTGRCGACEFADLCGGSRARAYAATGDPRAEDPACVYVPDGHPTGV